MSHNPRHDRITSLLQTLRTLSVSELSVRLGVSEVTVRKDLSILEERGLVARSHGRAALAQDIEPIAPVARRNEERAAAKEAIAAAAMRLISDGDIVALDAGSTTLAVARALLQRPVRIVTNSLPIAELYSGETDATLTLLGGSYRREAASFIGPITEQGIRTLRVDVALIGATAFTADGAFFCRNAVEGQTKHQLLTVARRRVIVADAAKFNAGGFARFADAEIVDVLISDTDFGSVDLFQTAGVEVLLASAMYQESGG